MLAEPLDELAILRSLVERRRARLSTSEKHLWAPSHMIYVVVAFVLPPVVALVGQKCHRPLMLSLRQHGVLSCDLTEFRVQL